MDAVSFIHKIRTEFKKRSEQEVVMLSCSALGILYLPPFIIYRIINEDWSMAVIDSLVFLIMVLFFRFNYMKGSILSTRLTMSAFLMIACMAVVYLKGISSIFWYFPAVIVVYYLLKPIHAVLISLSSAVTLSFILYSSLESIVFASILVPCILMNLILYITFNSYAKIEKQLTKLVTIDSLTGVRNRRSLTQELANIVMSQRRIFFNISLIMFDLDNFKKINDEHGHVIGDEVLIHIAKIFSLNIRASDSLFRYGGEEFVILLPDVNLPEAFTVSENLRKLVAASTLPSGITATVSMGVAQQLKAETAVEWLKRADAALYKAKQNGRDQVVISQ
ncbi:GGDEF domain-containing protein [Aliamphritea ceti]|uniref:GGDEF domain-containing protein n=1 Tax=Aliamphritea ceti TaxID=1524258 RepID=UPI0021C485C1|nr:GGDEF domain-containing protein [Aliamphritea ceti]